MTTTLINVPTITEGNWVTGGEKYYHYLKNVVTYGESTKGTEGNWVIGGEKYYHYLKNVVTYGTNGNRR